MVPKRNFGKVGGEEFDFPVPESKRRSLFTNVARDVMRDGSLNEKVWENFFRRVVRDELEKKFPILGASPSCRPQLQIGSSSGVRGFELHFTNKLPSPIFTGSKIESEDGSPLQIVLLDALTKNVVRSGPLSSVKIEILVMNSEFGYDDKEDWTEEDFTKGLIREREGKRPLVTGEVTLNLRDGVCTLGNLVFTDNSSWIRSRNFRLAAKVVNPKDEPRIREAVSEPFIVKDHRGESYKKHYPPCLDDEIWRLEKIAKDGTFHRRLSKQGITHVNHLLWLYVKDQSLLRHLFGKISKKTWDTIIQHARTCEIDKHKLYAYHRADHETSLLFNSNYEFVGALFDNQFCSLDQLTPPQKVLVESLKQHAYKNLETLVHMDASAVFALVRPSGSLQPEPFTNPDQQHFGYQFTNQDEQPMQLGFHHASPSTSFSYQPECSNQFTVSVAPTSHVFTPGIRNSFSMEDFGSGNFTGENSLILNGLQGQMDPTAHFGTTENHFQVQQSAWSPMTAFFGGQGNGICFASSSDTEAGSSSFVHNSSTIRRPKACWCKLRAAIKVWVSVRARRMARPIYLGN